MRVNYRPLDSLQAGCWFKLICGASYQDLPAIRNLALAYAIAGADCVDVAADPAVVAVVKEAFSVVSQLRNSELFFAQFGFEMPLELPLLMVSFSDGEDPHFRKAQFDPAQCPADCARPCESICPTGAIAFDQLHADVLEERCYGCGRCLSVCPIQQIETVTRATAIDAIAPTLLPQVDAIEIHTQVGRYDSFMALWSAVRPYLSHLQVISVSCPDQANVVDYLWQLYEGMQPLPLPLIWQTDGRSMSGDIGKGTTHATLRYAQKVLQAGPPGFVQLAGGTNSHTVDKLGALATSSQEMGNLGLLHPEVDAVTLTPVFGGVAYGSFARRLLSACWPEAVTPLFAQSVSTLPFPMRNSAYDFDDLNHLNTSLNQLASAVELARTLIAPLKTSSARRLLTSLSTIGDRLSYESLAVPPSYSPLFE